MVSPQPPDTKKFEKDLQSLNTQIAAKKDQWISVVGNRSQNIAGELDNIRKEIDEIRKELREISNRTRGELKPAIEKKHEEEKAKQEEIDELRQEVTYSSRKDLEQAIKKVEQDYHSRTFCNAKDENAYVKHLDKLKKQRKKIPEVERASEEKREIRSLIRAMQRERDELHTEGTRMKNKLDRELRPKQKILKLQREKLRADLEDLTQRRKKLIENYECCRVEYNEQMSALGLPVKQNRHDNANKKLSRASSLRQKEAVDHTDRNDDSDVDEFAPFEAEKRLCRSLIAYLRSQLPPGEQVSSEHDGSPDRGSDHSSSLAKTDSLSSVPESDLSQSDVAGVGMKILRRHSKAATDETGLSLSPTSQSKQSKRKQRISKRDSKRKAHQPLTIRAELISQFAELELNYPKFFHEIPDAIESLKEKLKFFEDQLSFNDGDVMSMLYETMSTTSLGSYLSSEDSDSALASFSQSFSDLSLTHAYNSSSACSESNLASPLSYGGEDLPPVFSPDAGNAASIPGGLEMRPLPGESVIRGLSFASSTPAYRSAAVGKPDYLKRFSLDETAAADNHANGLVPDELLPDGQDVADGDFVGVHQRVTSRSRDEGIDMILGSRVAGGAENGGCGGLHSGGGTLMQCFSTFKSLFGPTSTQAMSDADSEEYLPAIACEHRRPGAAAVAAQHGHGVPQYDDQENNNNKGNVSKIEIV